jgi:prefoldin beta subunit
VTRPRDTRRTQMATPELDQQRRKQVEQLRRELDATSQKARQCSQQYLENAMVLRELEDVGEDGTIYKMMGGVLIKQEHVEAVSNVKKRMDWIKAEETRCMESIEALQKKASKVMES